MRDDALPSRPQTDKRRVIVTAQRAPSGVWALEADVGAFSQIADLDQAEDEMREAVAYLLGVAEADVEIVVKVIGEDEQTEDVEAYRQAKMEDDGTRISAADLRAELQRDERHELLADLAVRNDLVPGDLLHQVLQRLDLTPEAVADEIGLDVEQMQALLDGRREVGLQLALRMDAAGIGTVTMWLVADRMRRSGGH